MIMQKNHCLKNALKLLTSHLGGVLVANIFCIIFSTLMANPKMAWIPAVVILIIYSLPIYGTLWTMGSADKNSEKYGKLQKNPFRGFVVGLIQNSPFILTGIMFLLSKFGIGWNIVIPFKLLNAEIMPIVNLLVSGENSVYLSSYTVFDAVIIALLPLIPVLFDGVYYLLGYFGISPWQMIVYKNKPAEK